MSKCGFLNIYKEQGLSSHDVVAKLRKILNIRKIGHAGTLDPFATGVLPVAIGPSTRLIRFLKKSKRYLAEIDFRYQTDTDDLTGEKLDFQVGEAPFHVVVLRDKYSISEGEEPSALEPKFKEIRSGLEFELEKFKGDIVQIPPLYSAVRHNGKRLYEMMRSGEEFDIDEVKKREVKVFDIQIINFEYPIVTVDISCSEGTYVRSIARDLGGHLKSLIRLESNGFEIKSAVKLDDENLESYISQVNESLEAQVLQLSEAEILDLQQGKKVYILDEDRLEGLDFDKAWVQCLNSQGELAGIANLVKTPKAVHLQPKVVL